MDVSISKNSPYGFGIILPSYLYRFPVFIPLPLFFIVISLLSRSIVTSYLSEDGSLLLWSLAFINASANMLWKAGDICLNYYDKYKSLLHKNTTCF